MSDEEQFLRQFVPGGGKAYTGTYLIAISIMSILVLINLIIKFDEEATSIETPAFNLVFIRWTLALYLHLIIDKDIKQGLRLMKYALNHPWKFTMWPDACFVGLFQLSLAVVVEIFSMLILLSAWSYLAAVKDFVAVIVINDFDNMIFDYFQDDNVSKLIAKRKIEVGCINLSLTDLLKIETTSSFKPQNEFGDPIPIQDIEPAFKGEYPSAELKKYVPL